MACSFAAKPSRLTRNEVEAMSSAGSRGSAVGGEGSAVSGLVTLTRNMVARSTVVML
jgi:hypothetical protein